MNRWSESASLDRLASVSRARAMHSAGAGVRPVVLLIPLAVLPQKFINFLNIRRNQIA